METGLKKICAYCGLPPRKDASSDTEIKLKKCSRCKIVFYHDAECQKKHWKVGGHRAECAALVTSSSSQGTAVEATGGDITGVAEGKEGETDGEATADTPVSGNGGGRQKKKGGGKKGKKKGLR